MLSISQNNPSHVAHHSIHKIFKITGVISACLGAFMLPFHVVLVIMGPAGLEGMNTTGTEAGFLFVHFSTILFYIGLYGLFLSTLLLVAGVSIYYGKLWGKYFLLSAIWLYIAYILVLLVSWVMLVPTMAGTDTIGRVICWIFTIFGLVFGLAIVFGLIILAKRIRNKWIVDRGSF